MSTTSLPSELSTIKNKLERSHLWLQEIKSEMASWESLITLPTSSHLAEPSRQSMLFYRDYGGFTGGHLKVWDYFNHVRFSQSYAPFVYFTPQSSWEQNNPWLNSDKSFIVSDPLVNPDLIFMEGLDWHFLDVRYKNNSPVPIINLVQHVRHAYPNNTRYSFLNHRAIRICVSPEIKTYLEETHQVNGEIFVIPCGLDLSELPQSLDWDKKDCDLLICALKEPILGQQLKIELEKTEKKVELLTAQIPRTEYLQKLNSAKMTVFLPNQQEGEGFYLPALEGMALGTLVICPDCIGNRSFCLSWYNCIRPDYRVESLLNTIQQALQYPRSKIREILTQAKQTANEHNLLTERQAFLEILDNVREIW
jgi:hypothetical protein